ncbi:MAG TPA: BamA/TamA family outer membrane protein [Polyangiaceae bacterium]|nr:BamA/TamA family outer membrane protein [Polyangiaceae bacterium]
MPRAYGRQTLAFAFALALSWSGEARAAEPANTKAAAPENKPAPRDKKREVPDYDGRGSPQPEPGEGWLWVPRVVLFPLYVVSEYVVRRPLGWVTVEAERARLPTLLLDFFTFGPDRQAGLVPTALFDFGFRPSVGLYFFWNDAIAEDNQIRLYASTGGPGWLNLTVSDRVLLSKHTKIGVRGHGSRRPDWLFYGFGPRSDDDNGGRYEAETLEASLFVDHRGWRSSRFRAFTGVRSTTFEDEGCCDDPSVGDLVRAGRYPYPPGFFTGYRIAHHGMIAELDSRPLAPKPGSGLRLVLGAEQAGRIDGGDPSEWIRYGGSIGGHWDVTDHNRVLGLTLTARFVDPIRSNAEIPFTEQVTFGGSHPLRGFIDGRLVDRSAVAARLDYQWPIWVFFDGTLSAEVGNVFGEHLAGFEPGANRLSFSIGFRDSGHRDHPFELLIGGGTKPIDEGAEFESFRFVLGATSAF